MLAELEDEDFCGDPEDLDDENEDDSGDDYDEFTVINPNYFNTKS